MRSLRCAIIWTHIQVTSSKKEELLEVACKGLAPSLVTWMPTRMLLVLQFNICSASDDSGIEMVASLIMYPKALHSIYEIDGNPVLNQAPRGICLFNNQHSSKLIVYKSPLYLTAISYDHDVFVDYVFKTVVHPYSNST